MVLLLKILFFVFVLLNKFQEIYKLDVIEIPTNRPIARIDENDAVYKTEKAKFNAVIDHIVACNAKNQPLFRGV